MSPMGWSRCRRDLRRARRAPELLGQVGRGGEDPALQLLHPARRADHPAVVAEVLAHLAADRGHGVGQEVVLPVGVIAARSLHQAQAGDLLEVVGRDAPVAVAARDALGDAQVGEHQLGLVGGLGSDVLR